MMPLWLLVVLISLATYRTTRLITRDQLPLIAVPRNAFALRWGTYVDATDKKLSINGNKTNVFMRSVAYLWECDWCASMWVSALITTLAYHWTVLGTQHWSVAVLVGLTASAVTGLIAQREPD